MGTVKSKWCGGVTVLRLSSHQGESPGWEPLPAITLGMSRLPKPKAQKDKTRAEGGMEPWSASGTWVQRGQRDLRCRCPQSMAMHRALTASPGGGAFL